MCRVDFSRRFSTFFLFWWFLSDGDSFWRRCQLWLKWQLCKCLNVWFVGRTNVLLSWRCIYIPFLREMLRFPSLGATVLKKLFCSLVATIHRLFFEPTIGLTRNWRVIFSILTDRLVLILHYKISRYCFENFVFKFNLYFPPFPRKTHRFPTPWHLSFHWPEFESHIQWLSKSKVLIFQVVTRFMNKTELLKWKNSFNS